MSTCDQCLQPLYPCDLLSGLTVCVECARKALRASRVSQHPSAGNHLRVANTKDAEWEVFAASVRQVAAEHDGIVDWTFVRPLIRGRIQHKHIGQFVGKAKRIGLLEDHDFHRSEDHAGKNVGRMEPRYKLGAVA